MLFVFGVLLVKGLFAGSLDYKNCDEFAHIHLQKWHKVSAQAQMINPDTANSNGDSDENCHEGKSIFAYSTTPVEIFDFAIPKYEIIHDVIFSLENHFQSPYLEPQRKPPKYS